MNQPNFKRFNLGPLQFNKFYYSPLYLSREGDIKKFPSVILIDNENQSLIIKTFVHNKVFEYNFAGCFNFEHEIDIFTFPNQPYLFVYNYGMGDIHVFSLVHLKESEPIPHLFTMHYSQPISKVKIDENNLYIFSKDIVSIYAINFYDEIELEKIEERRELNFPHSKNLNYNYETEEFSMKKDGEILSFNHSSVESFVYGDDVLIALIKPSTCEDPLTAIFDVFKIEVLRDINPNYIFIPEKSKGIFPDVEILPSLKGILPNKRERQFVTFPDYQFRDPDDIANFREMLNN